MENTINKQTSKAIQIIAILMMVFHHTFAFPERYLNGISYIGLTIGSIQVEQFIGSMCKICVTLFAFGTGYAFSKRVLSLKYITQKTFGLLMIYWFSLLLFLIAKALDGGSYSALELLKNAGTFSCSINPNAWYLSFYIFALITLLIIQKTKAKWWALVAAILCCVPINYILEANSTQLPFSLTSYPIYIPIVLAGYYLNNKKVNRFLDFLYSGKKGLMVSIVLLTLCLCLRVITGSSIYGFRFIWIYGPIIYFSLASLMQLLLKKEIVDKVVSIGGGYTTEIWLFHGLFTAPILWIQTICFLPRISILIYLWEIILCVVLAVFYKGIYRLILSFR